jgi:hypothetical protein
MDLKNLSDRDLENLYAHQKRVLFLLGQSQYGFEKYSSKAIHSMIDEALDKILLIQKEIERRKHEKGN